MIIPEPQRCMTYRKGYYSCSLPVRHSGAHEAYNVHDLDKEFLGSWDTFEMAVAGLLQLDRDLSEL